ncbi:hypothetical protein BX600DRAFT_511797 [Xylariales sp. PMI_506]|nr:hypothetical protein BX600DRAFT_511797 [Xylariales sp. PMI_506]
MAHQAHNIPWNVFASNFRYVYAWAKHQDVTHLYPRYQPNQGKELSYFVEAFTRTIEEHAVTERRKYPDQYEAASPETVVLSDATVRLITPTVQRFRQDRGMRKGWTRKVDPALSTRPCAHEPGADCACPVQSGDRRMATFLHRWVQNDCYRFFERNEAAFLGVELVKSLLVYGELDTVLRICAHPDVDYLEWWSQGQCYDSPYNLGWNLVCMKALKAYLGLNVLYCFPELWDEKSGRAPEKDYLCTSIYQRILRECTWTTGDSDIAAYPHQQFFGIAERQFREYPKFQNEAKYAYVDGRRGEYPYGVAPMSEFLELEATAPYLAHSSDVGAVRQMLFQFNLPAELVTSIMELADYTPRRRLRVAHDPLHPENREELGEYLTYSWKLMIRCDLMAKALGDKIPWDRLVSRCIIDLFAYGQKRGRKGLFYSWEHDDDAYAGASRIQRRESEIYFFK